jgi:hypothetical protein
MEVPLRAVTVTISSNAVSGSITRVKGTLGNPVAAVNVIEVSEEVIADANVVATAVEE